MSDRRVIRSPAGEQEKDRIPALAPLSPALLSDGAAEARQLLSEADALGIPWRKILAEEILTEGTLRRYAGDPSAELALWRAICILPNSLLQSWRVRALIDLLSWEASLKAPTTRRGSSRPCTTT